MNKSETARATHRLLAQRVALLGRDDEGLLVQYEDGSTGIVRSESLVSIETIDRPAIRLSSFEKSAIVAVITLVVGFLSFLVFVLWELLQGIFKT